jgi:hypothetical protein
MTKFLLLCIVLLPQDNLDPKITITGPKQRAAQRSAIIKIVYIGDDLKISSNAPMDQYNLVKFFGDNSVAILFDPEKEGVYYFAAAVNSNKKSAVAIHVITIGTPAPAPVPPGPVPPGPVPLPLDSWSQKLQDGFRIDVAAGVGKVEHRAALIAAYKQGVKDFIPTSKTNDELFKKQKTLNETLIGVGTCPNVRQIIADEAVAQMGKVGSTPLDTAKATLLWNKIVDSLNKISEK